MSCLLHAIGRGFDIDAFLADTQLRPAAVYHEGDPRLPDAPDGPKREASGFRVPVSDAGFDDLEGQVRDAIEFLDQHEDELRRLGAFPNVEAMCLDFGIRWRDTAVQTDAFPPDLLWRAGALDIAISLTHHLIADTTG